MTASLENGFLDLVVPELFVWDVISIGPRLPIVATITTFVQTQTQILGSTAVVGSVTAENAGSPAQTEAIAIPVFIVAVALMTLGAWMRRRRKQSTLDSS